MMPRGLKVTCLMLFVASSSHAQAPGTDAGAALRESFGKVSGWISQAADLVPPDKYSYQPAATVRTYGQLVAHVADEYVYYCSRAAGRNVEWSDAIEKGNTDKPTVTRKLREALAGCTAAYGRGGGPVGALVDNLADSYLHYGNIVTYLRLLGIVPPSSR